MAGSSSDMYLARAALRQHFSKIQRAMRDAYSTNLNFMIGRAIGSDAIDRMVTILSALPELRSQDLGASFAYKTGISISCFHKS